MQGHDPFDWGVATLILVLSHDVQDKLFPAEH